MSRPRIKNAVNVTFSLSEAVVARCERLARISGKNRSEVMEEILLTKFQNGLLGVVKDIIYRKSQELLAWQKIRDEIEQKDKELVKQVEEEKQAEDLKPK